MLRKIGIITLVGVLFGFASGPLLSHAQSTLSVQTVAQQSQTILPGNPLFASYETRFYRTLGVSSTELAQKLQAMTTESAAPQSTQAGQAMTVSISPEYKNTDLKTEVVANGKTLLVGTVELTRAGALGGVALSAGKYGVAAMKGSFVIVLINISNGNVVAFIVISDPLIFGFGFLPIFFPFEIFFQVAFVIPFPLLFPPFFFPPFFVTFAGCPVMGRAVAVDVTVGSGATIITSPSSGQPTLAIKDGGRLGVLTVESLEPAKRPLRFQLLSLGRIGFGFVGEGAAGHANVSVFDTPFVLIASDDQGHSACLSAFVLFPGIIFGSATSN